MGPPRSAGGTLDSPPRGRVSSRVCVISDLTHPRPVPRVRALGRALLRTPRPRARARHRPPATPHVAACHEVRPRARACYAARSGAPTVRTRCRCRVRGAGRQSGPAPDTHRQIACCCHTTRAHTPLLRRSDAHSHPLTQPLPPHGTPHGNKPRPVVQAVRLPLKHPGARCGSPASRYRDARRSQAPLRAPRRERRLPLGPHRVGLRARAPLGCAQNPRLMS